MPTHVLFLRLNWNVGFLCRTRKLFKIRGFEDYTRTHIQVSQNPA